MGSVVWVLKGSTNQGFLGPLPKTTKGSTQEKEEKK